MIRNLTGIANHMHFFAILFHDTASELEKNQPVFFFFFQVSIRLELPSIPTATGDCQQFQCIIIVFGNKTKPLFVG